jgi:phage gpG-like protein
MAESFTSYQVDNDRKFRNALKEAAQTVEDFRVPFGLILSDFYKSQQAIWKLKGPGKYPPFKGERNPKTGMTAYQAQKKKAVGFDYPLLVRSGALAASLSGPSNPGSISKITNLSLIFGSSIKYGIYHQSDEPRSKIPLRKFLFIGPEAASFATDEQKGRLERWVGYINDHVARQIKKQGF